MLPRPQGLGDEEWEAIRQAEERLARAKQASDSALVVGSAKELCETIAKVVLSERRGSVDHSDMGALISAAHKELEFQPGEGLANDPETRKLAQGLKSIVMGVAEMRNRHGTGHGRARPSGVTEEHAVLAQEAAMLWSSWALRRLEPYIAGDVTRLVRDLESQIFHRGELALRLQYADLPRLSEGDQRRLGVAVARRASRGTFVVAEDGIRAVDAGDATKWPEAYVEGLVDGLLFDPDGYFVATPAVIKEVARLVAALPDPSGVLEGVRNKVDHVRQSGRLVFDEETRQELVRAFVEGMVALPEGAARECWGAITDKLEFSDSPTDQG